MGIQLAKTNTYRKSKTVPNMCQAQILAVSASFVCYERTLSLSLNGAINTKALGTSCYYDSSILF